MPNQTVSNKVLIDLFELTRRGDQAAREELKGWFDGCVQSMLDGREGRRQIGMLAYLMAQKQASRKLAQGGRFDDLQNDPDSVASLHWQRFQPFCEDIERGEPKTVDEFVIRVNALTRYVLLDITKKTNKTRDQESPFDDESQVADPLDDEGSEAESLESIEQKRALLRQIFQVLPSHLFLVVVLNGFCGMKLSEIADILGKTPYYVKEDLKKASFLIGKHLPFNP